MSDHGRAAEGAGMPRWSEGVRWEPFGDGMVLHDEARAEVHVLNQTAALVWIACDGVTPLAQVVADLSERSGASAAQIDADVRTHLDVLRSAGLVDRRDTPPEVRPPAPGRVEGRHRTPALLVLDEPVVLRSNDRALIDHLRLLLGDLEADVAPSLEGPTIELGLDRLDDGRIRLHGRGHDEAFDDQAAVDEAVVSLINRVTATAGRPLALHAGAVRAPSGEVLVLPAGSGSGKSTLAAALVAAGWDYLTDEAAGVRVGSLTAVGYPKPLSLDRRSQQLLGIDAGGTETVPVQVLRPGARAVLGDAGPVRAIVLPAHRAGAPTRLDRLDPADAFVAVAGQAINLTPAGQAGLRTLTELAQRVPTYALEHGGIDDAVPAVIEVLGT